jgi:hypothetical protein
VFASAVLQDVLGTARTFLRLLLDGRERRVFLVGAVFDAELVLSARLVLVPWAVAWDAGFAAAFVACEDALEVLLPLMLLLLLSLPPLPQPLQIPEKFLVVLLDELLLLKWLMRCNIPRPLHNVLGPTTRDYGTIVVDVDLLGMPWTSIIDILARPIAWDVHLSSATAWSQTPAPPRSILSSVNSLQLSIPSKRLRQQPNRKKILQDQNNQDNKPRKKLLRNRTLDVLPPHLLLTLRARDPRRENARLDLRLDPFFQAALARVDHVLARRGRVAVGELRGDAADHACLAFVALRLDFAAFGGGRHGWIVFFGVR